MPFTLSFGDKASIKSWSLAIGGKDGTVRHLAGEKASLPATLTWDGADDKGGKAAEGSFVATLAIDYGEAFIPTTVVSKPFLLVITPPSGSFTPDPLPLRAASGADFPVPVTVNVDLVAGLAKPTTWKLSVLDEAGAVLRSISSPVAKTESAWDGLAEDGRPIDAALAHRAVLTVIDEYGNEGTWEGHLSALDTPGAENSSIATDRRGFSPNSATQATTLEFLLSMGSRASVEAWTVTILDRDLKAVRIWKGEGTGALPETLSWDGNDEAGTAAAEGTYTATLAIDYGRAFKPALVSSPPFTLAREAPAGKIVANPPTMAPAAIGPASPATFTIEAASNFAFIARWSMSLVDVQGLEIGTWEANWPKATATWDGRGPDGALVAPDTALSLVAKVEDEYGNVGELSGTFALGSLPSPSEASRIAARKTGFAPMAKGEKTTIEFDLAVGHPDSIKAWRLEFVTTPEASDKPLVANFLAGEGLPGELSWDGKEPDGTWAPEGSYRAALSLDYGLEYARTRVESEPFSLALSSPRVTLSLPDWAFTPDDDGENDFLTITMEATSGVAKILGWDLTILDPMGTPTITWSGAWPADPITWDGRDAKGDLVESASDYTVRLEIRDEFGNRGLAEKGLVTGILVTKDEGGYRIRVPGIVFKPFTSDFIVVESERKASNLSTIDYLAMALRRFPDYRIRLEGHAVMVYWDDAKKGTIEQEEVLIPLSLARAEAVRAALVTMGLPEEIMVATGLGANRPVVPDSDLDNRWKNRRVDFYLVK